MSIPWYVLPKYEDDGHTNIVLGEKEISKGTLGQVTRNNNETIFTFFKTNIDKRKKLKEEMDTIIKSFKEHKIKEGILNIKKIKTNNTSYTIITEPIIDSLSNLHNFKYNKFKGFEIFKMFDKFNIFIKYCLDKNINLSNLNFSDIYLTKNLEIKLFTINYDTEIIHKIKKEKFNVTHNNKNNNNNNNKNNNNNILYLIGNIMYYLYYNEYPKKNETKFPGQKHFKELLQYCLNINTKFEYNEYINHTFFHPDIIFPNNTKKFIRKFSSYTEYKPNKGTTNYKIIDENKKYINEIIKIKDIESNSVIYHEFFEEEIFKFNDRILCLAKKKDGTYLAGGYYNNIIQIYFDKYGFVELISKVDSGF